MERTRGKEVRNGNNTAVRGRNSRRKWEWHGKRKLEKRKGRKREKSEKKV